MGFSPDSLVAHWESVGEEGSEAHSSSDVDDNADTHILTEEDFASAVARAAQMSGLTVVGSRVTDPNHNQKQGGCCTLLAFVKYES